MTAWILTMTPDVCALVSAARDIGGPVRAVLVGHSKATLAGVDSLTVMTPDRPDAPLEAVAAAVAEGLDCCDGDVVLVPDRETDRVLAGALAARHHAPVLTAVRRVGPQEATVGRFGGVVEQTVSLGSTTTVLVMDPGGALTGPQVAAEQVTVAAGPVTVVSQSAADHEVPDLSKARRVVAVGRGLRQESDLAIIGDLARALGAEVACSRPLAEGLGWMPKETYVGVSGLHLSPELYVAVGISGQLQHMVGCQGARCVVAVNTDEKAPVMEQADYAVVGDLYDVVPALTAELGGR